MWNYLVSGLLAGADDRAVRRRPGPPDLDTLWDLAAEHRLTVFGVVRAVPHGLPQGRRDAGARSRCAGSARPARRCRPTGSAGSTTPLGVPVASISGGTDVCTAFLGVVAAACRCAPARSAAGCSAARSRPSRPTAMPCPPGVTGELVITAPMPSMPVGLLGRRRRLALPRGLLRGLPRRVAPRRLDHVHRRRRVRRSPAVPTPRSTAAACASARATSTPSSRRSPEVADSLVVHLEDDDGEGGSASCCCSSRSRPGADARRRPARRDPAGAAHASCRRATSPTRSRPCRRCRARCRARSSRCPVKRILDRHRRRRGRVEGLARRPDRPGPGSLGPVASRQIERVIAP